MSTRTSFIDRLRAKPEHERKRIALLTSGALTALIALFWMTANISAGTFAITGPASSEKGTLQVSQGLAGAGAALFVPDNSGARLEAVLPAPEEEPSVQETPTVIPF